MKPKKRKCVCKIRGIVELYEIKDGIYHVVHPMDYRTYFSSFKYCPLCGREIKVKEDK